MPKEPLKLEVGKTYHSRSNDQVKIFEEKHYEFKGGTHVHMYVGKVIKASPAHEILKSRPMHYDGNGNWIHWPTGRMFDRSIHDLVGQCT